MREPKVEGWQDGRGGPPGGGGRGRFLIQSTSSSMKDSDNVLAKSARSWHEIMSNYNAMHGVHSAYIKKESLL